MLKSLSVAAQLGGAMANRGRKHVLVVDDNSMMLKLIKEYLHETYDVATAVSGKIAMKFLERRMTNLILLDYEMPGENGPAVLEQLRANEATKDIPVFTIIGATKSIRPAWQEYTMDAPFLRAMDAPFLLHCSQRTRPMLEALVYLQNSQKLEPSVTATPSAFVVITAISLVSE